MEKKNPRTLLDAMRHFDPETAQAYIEAIKWSDGPCCPKCGSIKVGRIVSRNRLRCRERECRCQFSLMTGTIFEANIPTYSHAVSVSDSHPPSKLKDAEWDYADEQFIEGEVWQLNRTSRGLTKAAWSLRDVAPHIGHLDTLARRH